MKPHFIRRNNNLFKQSFSVNRNATPHFLKLWHYHPELEIVYIARSTGTRFIGDSIERFEPGELVLLGENLPHKWQNDKQYFDENSTLRAEALVAHFQRDFLGECFDRVSELKSIGQLLNRARRGIIFYGRAASLVPPMMERILNMEEGFERLTMLLEVMHILAAEKNCRYIVSLGYQEGLQDKDDRLGRVYDFVMNNFQHNVSLDSVAQQANMNKSAFCRYFKRATGKNFSQYLNEIRVGYACKLLLQQKHKAISEICYESGFNNLSNFNQQFKKIQGFSPSAYLHKYSEYEMSEAGLQ